MSLLTDLQALGPNGKAATIKALAHAAPTILAQYEINTPLRMAHFWAQASHECAGFRTMFEIWGPTKAQARYEGRRDLGNVTPGDGHRFRGRGIFQLTGRANYAAMSKALGLDLVAQPDLAAKPENALRIACEYWRTRGLNKLADVNDLEAITRKINGGLNGLADRRANFIIAWRLWGDNDARPAPAKTIAKSREANAAIVAGGASAAAAAAEIIPHVATLSEALGRPAVLALIVAAIACAAIWFWRKQRLDAEVV
jgi:putative chitinase